VFYLVSDVKVNDHLDSWRRGSQKVSRTTCLYTLNLIRMAEKAAALRLNLLPELSRRGVAS